MKPRKRLRLWVKVVIFLLPCFLVFFIVNTPARNKFFPYFDTRCRDFHQKDYSRRLNDRLVDYGPEAKRTGIIPCVDNSDLKNRISSGELVRIRSGSLFRIADLNYSIPYVTRSSSDLLEEIARRFREKAAEKGLKKARFTVTSLTRKKDNLKMLRRTNSNSSENSPHLYGNAFDISYKSLTARKLILTNCDRKFLKDVLGEVIWELRQERRCWATYERMQNCYHVVAR
ncbi:MAG TPA: DUF5715 family protein [Bacteroidales bacterium]|nr:DUF5715 family protein [Bacteroidales bacterium]